MSIISSAPGRQRARAQAAALAAILGLLSGGQAMAPASAAAEPNMGTPGVCKPGQVWDFYGQQCMATEEILVSGGSGSSGGSGATPPHDPGPRPIGPRPSDQVGPDDGGGIGNGRPPRPSPSMSPAPTKWDQSSSAEKREGCGSLDFAIRKLDHDRWAIERGRDAGESVYIAKPDVARGTMGRWEWRSFNSVADVTHRQTALKNEFKAKGCPKRLAQQGGPGA